MKNESTLLYKVEDIIFLKNKAIAWGADRQNDTHCN
jgi:hypothetical protein